MILHDDAASFEVTRVHEYQVVLVNVVTEEKEYHQEEADRRHYSRED